MADLLTFAGSSDNNYVLRLVQETAQLGYRCVDFWNLINCVSYLPDLLFVSVHVCVCVCVCVCVGVCVCVCGCVCVCVCVL